MSEQNEYEIRVKKDNNDEIILEAYFRDNGDKVVDTYNTNSKKWKYSKVNKNTYMLYNKTEL